MEKSLEMLVEYVLERCTGLETERRRLSQQLQKAEDRNDMLLDGYTKQADQLAKLAKLIKPSITWAKEKPEFLTIVNTPVVEEICDILRVKKDDTKTI